MIGYQPPLLVIADGRVFQHPDQHLAESGATLAAAALGVLGPVEVLHFEEGFVLSLFVTLGIPSTGFRAVAYSLAHDRPSFVRPLVWVVLGLNVTPVIHTRRRRRQRPSCIGRRGGPGVPALCRGPGPRCR